MVVNDGRVPEVLFKPVFKSSASLSNILNRTVDGWALVLVNDPTLLYLGVLIFGCHE